MEQVIDMYNFDYVSELNDVTLRLRADLESAISEYNDFADTFYYKTYSKLTTALDTLNLSIFESNSCQQYVRDTFDTPQRVADRLTDDEYSEASAAYKRLTDMASLVDDVRRYMIDLKRKLDRLEVAYIDDHN